MSGDVASAFDLVANTSIDGAFSSPSLPYLCSRDGSNRHLKDRLSRCRWPALLAKHPQLHTPFSSGAEARAVAASDDCSCAYVVENQFGVCEAVDVAIDRCSKCGACRLVDVSPSTCLVPTPAPSRRHWSRVRQEEQAAFGSVTYGTLRQQQQEASSSSGTTAAASSRSHSCRSRVSAAALLSLTSRFETAGPCPLSASTSKRSVYTYVSSAESDEPLGSPTSRRQRRPLPTSSSTL